MKGLGTSLLVIMLGMLITPSARAYTIGTSITEPCHELISLTALERVTAPPLSPTAEPDAPRSRMTRGLRSTLGWDGASDPVSDALFLALVVGVREVDLRGAAPVHVTELRGVHLPDHTQADHFLRDSTHDHFAGDEDAATAGRARLLELIEASAIAYDADPQAQNLTHVDIWIEHHGQVSIQVWEPLFLLAQALHLLQDSFTHTYRTEDTHGILAIQNYADAIEHHYDRERDGPPHSASADNCTHADGAALRESATQASAELLTAVFEYWSSRDRVPVDTVTESWLSLDPSCRMAPGTDACVSPYLELAQRGETSPLFSCAASPGARPAPISLGLLLGLALWSLRRSRDRRRSRPASIG